MADHMKPPEGVQGVTRPFPTSFQRTLGRLRGPLFLAWVAMVVIDSFVVDLPGWLTLGATALVLAVYFRLGTPSARPRRIHAPVLGRWRALNSPASRVPSHSMHAYGQTYAMDLIHDPEQNERPESSKFVPIAHRPEAYPSFGQPVLAPIDGTVAVVHDSERDHMSRTSWLGILYLVVEGAVRELLGPRRIVGNHMVIDDGEGTFALVAHLRRHSAEVVVGDAVEAGQPIAECGNSGNSTEPHVHVQLMDHRNPYLACGLPFEFDPETVETGEAGIPANGRLMVGVRGSR